MGDMARLCIQRSRSHIVEGRNYDEDHYYFEIEDDNDSEAVKSKRNNSRHRHRVRLGGRANGTIPLRHSLVHLGRAGTREITKC